MKDLHHNLKYINVINPIGFNNNSPLVGTIIDMQGFQGLEFVIITGNLFDTAATFTVRIDEGSASNLSDATEVAAANLFGSEALASFDFSADNTIHTVGYNGNKRYVRLTITPAGNSTTDYLGALAVLGYSEEKPIS